MSPFCFIVDKINEISLFFGLLLSHVNYTDNEIVLEMTFKCHSRSSAMSTINRWRRSFYQRLEKQATLILDR